MRELKKAAAVFCIACICAELLAQMTGQGWARRCIKTVAGLYILLVFWNVLPAFRTTVQDFALPQVSAVDMGTLEDAVRAQTGKELAEQLEAECAAATGVSVRLTIRLEETSAGKAVSAVEAELPTGNTPQERAAVADFLQNVLGVAPTFPSAGSDREADP